MGRLPFASRLSKIFLSYRREDAAAYAGRIYDRLVAHFGKKRIFMDVDHILAGDDFVRVLEEAVAESEILLLLIGRHWLTVADSDGVRRLDNPEDAAKILLRLIGSQPKLVEKEVRRAKELQSI
ncbi:MAG: TIR domain-containing protein [Betaproteobacteria bacterium]|nr:TIR domain-containing protein [Betaproteobacteria bacterium]